MGDKKSQAIIFSGLGSAYWKARDFSKAKEYFEQSLVFSRELGDRKAEASVLINLASTYETVGDLVRATELYEHALELNNENKISIANFR
ncbi:MAG: tetratricopeptide repeat protein [Anaerolineales bacterium]|uniref:tetratricopeptide repeat protein n=1 Tax=Candidatus Villigracilis vicinus TaxID=3140679 RepID=UPI00313618D9|nr:tetratricopeptide repeat protein [Anaerolineales bacterium]